MNDKTTTGSDVELSAGLDALAAKIARDIFSTGSEPRELGGQAQRMQYMGGTYPDRERPMGGLCERALTNVIAESLKRHMESNTDFSRGAAATSAGSEG